MSKCKCFWEVLSGKKTISGFIEIEERDGFRLSLTRINDGRAIDYWRLKDLVKKNAMLR